MPKQENGSSQEASGLKKHSKSSTSLLGLEMERDVFHVQILFKDKSKQDIFIQRQQDLTYDLMKIIAIPNVSDVISIKAETLIRIGNTWLSRSGMIDSETLKKLTEVIGQ